jgi:hypothetical protein
LQVFIPQVRLTGKYMPVQGSCEQVPPGGTQIPQLALQQTSVTLHVLGPHCALMGTVGAPQKSGHVSPGNVHVLQFQLQHRWPAAQMRHPQRMGWAAGAGFSDVRVVYASVCPAAGEAASDGPTSAAAFTELSVPASFASEIVSAKGFASIDTRCCNSSRAASAARPAPVTLGVARADGRAFCAASIPAARVDASMAKREGSARSKGAASTVATMVAALGFGPRKSRTRSAVDSMTPPRRASATTAAIATTAQTTPEVFVGTSFALLDRRAKLGPCFTVQRVDVDNRRRVIARERARARALCPERAHARVHRIADAGAHVARFGALVGVALA